MVLLVFLVDTSASMNQKTCLGTTYLDLTKGAVESFLKIRARDTNANRGDRYMLVTFDDTTKSVKAGWRDSLQVFMKELKNLQGHGLSNLGRALKETFDLLNMHRLQSGIDNYGMGCNPYYLDPALVLLISDGSSMMDINGLISEIDLPSHNLLPGSELTKEFYRWDERLFALKLKVPGFAASVNDKLSVLQPEDLPLSNLCEQTGGKLYNIGSHKSLMQSLESIAQKIMIPGVIIHFEKIGPDPEPVAREVLQIGSTTPKREGDSSCPVTEEGELDTSAVLKNEKEAAIPNGFIRSPYASGKLPNGPLTNGLDQHKLPNGSFDLMPAPPLPPHGLPLIPLIPPIHLPGGMMPPMRGLLPLPIGGGILPPMLYPPQNRLLLPDNNSSTGHVNGVIDEQEIKPNKTEGQSSSPASIPDNLVRGDEQPPLDSNCDVVSPTAPVVTSTAWQSQRRMIYVRTNVKGTVGHWPIPENFWRDSSTPRLPPRNCHPIIKFQCKSSEAMVIDNMPFDKYELEPSPLTQYILERKQPNVAWQTFISGSSRDSEIGNPFGYLKASTNLQCVNLFVLPYNYTVLMPLLDELFKVHKCKPTLKWRQSFDEYIQAMPSYYSSSLRNALRRMSAPNNLIAEHYDGSLSYSIVSYLKKVKHQAKVEAEHRFHLHQQQHVQDSVQINLPTAPNLSDGKLKDFKQLLIQKSTSAVNKELYEDRLKLRNTSENEAVELFGNRNLPASTEKFQVRSFKNPFDIHRGDILKQVYRMRANYFHTTGVANKMQNEDSRHRISIAQMGNYQDIANQLKPLREVDPSQVRVHTFGNPFKLKQDQIIAVDEADVDNISFGQNSRKRAGENSASQKLVKRKRSEMPPPSRRPIGPPNTPPPKSLLLTKSNFEFEPVKQAIQSVTEQKSENNNELKTLEGEVVNDLVTNKKPNDKRTNSSSVNQQLRKLQQMHRCKKGSDKNMDIFTDTLDEISDTVNASPILSILRNSFEELDDKDNEELDEINIKKKINEIENIYKNTKDNTSRTPSATISNNHNFEHLSDDVERRALLELQKRSCVKIRLAIWRAVRDRNDFMVIKRLIDQLTASIEAKYIFIKKLIEETNRFLLADLSEKLRQLQLDLRRDVDR